MSSEVAASNSNLASSKSDRHASVPPVLPADSQAHLRIGDADTCLGLLAALSRWPFSHLPHRGSYTIIYLLEERKEEVAWLCPPPCVLASAVTTL